LSSFVLFYRFRFDRRLEKEPGRQLDDSSEAGGAGSEGEVQNDATIEADDPRLGDGDGNGLRRRRRRRLRLRLRLRNDNDHDGDKDDDGRGKKTAAFVWGVTAL
jgi:hypothetical protein